MCFCKSEQCCIGKHYYPGTRCKMTARHRDRDGERSEGGRLLRRDIICVSGSEHLSIYIQRSSATQWALMYNSCATNERAINTVTLLVSRAHAQHFCSPNVASKQRKRGGTWSRERVDIMFVLHCIHFNADTFSRIMCERILLFTKQAPGEDPQRLLVQSSIPETWRPSSIQLLWLRPRGFTFHCPL